MDKNGEESFASSKGFGPGGRRKKMTSTALYGRRGMVEWGKQSRVVGYLLGLRWCGIVPQSNVSQLGRHTGPSNNILCFDT